MVYIADFGMYEVIPRVWVVHKRKYRGRHLKWMDGMWRGCHFKYPPDKSTITYYELSWHAN